jgi:hypothetical protein
MNKTALFLSATLTVIVLIVVGAIVMGLRPAEIADNTVVSDPAATTEPGNVPEVQATATLDPQLEKIWMEREAAYQQTIAEANARLGELQQQLATQAVAAVDASQAAPITPEQAAAIAADYLNQTSVYSVSLVALGGGNVYEVVMSTGDIVYVSLDGQIVGSVPAAVISSGGGGGGGGQSVPGGNGGGNDGDHDDHGEHDDGHEGDDD